MLHHNLPIPEVNTTVDFMFFYRIWRDLMDNPHDPAHASSYNDPNAMEKVRGALASSPFLYDPVSGDLYNAQVLHNIRMLAMVQEVEVPFTESPNDIEVTVNKEQMAQVLSVASSPVQSTAVISGLPYPKLDTDEMGSYRESPSRGVLKEGSLATAIASIPPTYTPLYHTIERDGFYFHPNIYSVQMIAAVVADTYRPFMSPQLVKRIKELDLFINSIFVEYERKGRAYSFMNTHPMVQMVRLCRTSLKILDGLEQARTFNLDSKFRAIVTDVLPYLPEEETLRHCAEVASSLGSKVAAPNAQHFPDAVGYIPEAMLETLTLTVNLCQDLYAIRKRLILDNNVSLQQQSSPVLEKVRTLPFPSDHVLHPVYGFSEKVPSSRKLDKTLSTRALCGFLGAISRTLFEIDREVRILINTVRGALCEDYGSGYADRIDPNKDSYTFPTDGLQHFALLNALHSQISSMSAAAGQAQSALNEADSASSIVHAVKSALRQIPMGWSLYNISHKHLPVSHSPSNLATSILTITAGMHVSARNLTLILSQILNQHQRGLVKLDKCACCHQLTTLTPPNAYRELQAIYKDTSRPDADKWPEDGSLCPHCMSEAYSTTIRYLKASLPKKGGSSENSDNQECSVATKDSQ